MYYKAMIIISLVSHHIVEQNNCEQEVIIDYQLHSWLLLFEYVTALLEYLNLAKTAPMYPVDQRWSFSYHLVTLVLCLYTSNTFTLTLDHSVPALS